MRHCELSEEMSIVLQMNSFFLGEKGAALNKTVKTDSYR